MIISYQACSALEHACCDSHLLCLTMLFPGYNVWRQTTRTGNWIYKDVSKRHVSFTLKYWSILTLLSLELIFQAHSCSLPHSVFECPMFASNGLKWLIFTFDSFFVILAFLNIASDIILATNMSSVGNDLIISVEGPLTKELALTICTI